MIILGYLFTVINYIFYCISRFLVDKKNILLMDLIAKIFTILGLACLNSYSGAISFCITFALLIVANIKERKNKNWTLFFILFQISYVITLFLKYEGISSTLVFISCTINLICVWWLSPQKMRLLGCAGSVIYLLYQISIKNWVGLIEILVILSNFASYLKYRKKE